MAKQRKGLGYALTMAVKFEKLRADSDYEPVSGFLASTITDDTAVSVISNLADFVHASEGQVVIARDDGELVGVAVVSRNINDTQALLEAGLIDEASFIWNTAPMLELLAVSSSVRRRRVGTAILNYAVAAGRKLGGQVMHVVVQRDAEALTFFKETGFQFTAPGVGLVVPPLTVGGSPVQLELSDTHVFGLRALG